MTVVAARGRATSTSYPQHTESGTGIRRIRRWTAETLHPHRTGNSRSGSRMADGREAELRSRDLRPAVAAVRLGQDCPEIVRAAFFALQACLFRVRAMGMGMDGFTVGSEEPADDVSPSVLKVKVDVDPVDGKHVADDQQRGRQRREKPGSVLLRTHSHKYIDSPANNLSPTYAF